MACAAAAEVGTACRRDLAEVAARDVEIEVIGIIGEIRMIEHIGEARTRLEMDAFGDRELLRQPGREVDYTGADDIAVVRGTESSDRIWRS